MKFNQIYIVQRVRLMRGNVLAHPHVVGLNLALLQEARAMGNSIWRGTDGVERHIRDNPIITQVESREVAHTE